MTDLSQSVTITGTPAEVEAVARYIAKTTATIELEEASARLVAIRESAALGHIDPDAPIQAHAVMAMLNRQRIHASAAYHHACRQVPGGHARIIALLHSQTV